LYIDSTEEELQKLLLQFSRYYNVIPCRSGPSALDLIQKEKPVAVIMDIFLSDCDSFKLLSDIKRLPSPPPVLILSNFADPLMIVRALKTGAWDFMSKPYSFPLLRRRIELMIQESRPKTSVMPLLPETQVLIGSSDIIKRIKEEIQAYASSIMPVLILGESGTGKELVAQALHNRSSRSKGPFEIRNIASIPETLVSSELFGCIEGAYTGARTQKGCFVLANGGSLFLDEIGDAPMAIQASILRVLEDGIVRPLGSSKTQKVDCRLISATNQNLESLILQGRFREDLRYRLEGLIIEVPPLRDRPEDIPELVTHFLRTNQDTFRGSFRTQEISEDALEELMIHPWPGNIRQLRNCIVRAQLLAGEKRITQEYLRI